MTVQTTNDQNQRITTTTTTNYEQQQFKSHTDWRLRALSAANMQIRVNNVWVSNDDVKEGYTYVMPKNLLKRFVAISDLKVQIFAYLYGQNIEGGIKEIKAIVIVPQVGSKDGVTVPNQMPESEFLKGLEIVGWIHTSPEDKNYFSLSEAMVHAKFLS